MREFITSESFLGGLAITFQGDVNLLEENRLEKLRAVVGLLNQIEAEARQRITEHRGSHDFKPAWVREVFTNKVLKFDKRNPLVSADPQFEAFIGGKDWYVFNALYGTSEEKPFVRMLDRQIPQLREKYEAIYLVGWVMKGISRSTTFRTGKPLNPTSCYSCARKPGRFSPIRYSLSRRAGTSKSMTSGRKTS